MERVEILLVILFTAQLIITCIITTVVTGNQRLILKNIKELKDKI